MDSPSKKIQNEISQLVVFCAMKQQGCEWEGQIKDLDKHEEICEWMIVTCPNGCGQESPITRGQLDKHLESECSKREYSCKFSFAGCKVAFQRSDEKRHMKGHVENHIELLAKSVEMMNEEMKVLKSAIADGVKSAEADKKMEKVIAETLEQQKCQKEQNEEEMKIIRDKIVVERERVDELEKQVNNLQTNNTRDDISPPEHQGESEQKENNRLEMELKQKDAQIQQLQKSLKEHKKDLDDQRKASSYLERRILSLERQFQNGKIPPPQVKNEPGPLQPTFTMTSFKAHMEKRTSWFSPPFTAYDGGPGFKLEVWPYGQHEGRGTHISVWLDRTDIIESLTYVNIGVKLITRHNLGYPVSKEFNDIHYDRYLGGINEFMPHSELHYYKDNDCLKFQISWLYVECA